MTLTQYIDKIKEQGIMAVAPVKLKGEAKPVFDFLALMNDTEPEETMPEYWLIRAWLRRN